MPGISLPMTIIAENERVRSAGEMPSIFDARGGSFFTYFFGINSAYVDVQPVNGSASVVVEFQVPSVTSTGFATLRAAVGARLGGDVASAIARQSGVDASGVPPGGRMAEYARDLVSTLAPGVALDHDGSGAAVRHADVVAGGVPLVHDVHGLQVVPLSYRVTLDVDDHDGPVTATIPVSSFDFADGVIVPFAGYRSPVVLTTAAGAAVEATATCVLA